MNVLKQLQDIYILHRSAEQALEKIKICIRSTIDGGTPRSLLLLGDAGAGKTSLIDVAIANIVDNYPHEAINEHSFLVIEAPSPASLKALQSAFYSAMDASSLDIQRHTEAKRTQQIIDLINKKRYKVIVNDEIQHFTEKYKKNIETVVCDFYKTVKRETDCSFILVGKPIAERLVKTDDQLRRRFLSSAILNRFAPPLNKNNEFKAFIDGYKQACPVAINDFSEDFIVRLYVCCDGLPGLFHTLIELAIRSNPDKKHICMKDIEEAFEVEFQVSDILDFNPFNVSLLDVENWIKRAFQE